MFDFFRPKYKRDSDLGDARDLIERYGDLAHETALRRARDGHLSLRNRRHWRRISRIVARLQRQ